MSKKDRTEWVAAEDVDKSARQTYVNGKCISAIISDEEELFNSNL